MLVTNPPYSGEHKTRLLQYLLTNPRHKSSRNQTISQSFDKSDNLSTIPNDDNIIRNKSMSNKDKSKNKSNINDSLKMKPFALLLPLYTATKSYWKDFVTSITSPSQITITSKGNNDSNDNSFSSTSTPCMNGMNNMEVQYWLPDTSYEYRHPEGTGKDLPPFYSAWFIGGSTGEWKRWGRIGR